MKHYEVISPVIEDLGSYYEPPEQFRCFCFIHAENKKDAKVFAVMHPDMKEWVDYQRSDDMNPMTGLVVTESKCEHGRCYCPECTRNDQDEDFGSNCPLCIENYKARLCEDLNRQNENVA